MELADRPASKTGALKSVRVRLPRLALSGGSPTAEAADLSPAQCWFESIAPDYLNYGSECANLAHIWMERKTLLLSANYLPLQVIHWELAVKLKYEGTADVLVEYAEEIRSPSVCWKLPAVMRLKRERGRGKNRQVRFSRTGVYQRDGYRCAYCRKKFAHSDLTLDHVVPRCKGGLTDWRNVVSACRACNGAKGDKSCDQWGRWPANKPIVPRTLPEPGPRIDVANIPPEWDGFVSAES